MGNSVIIQRGGIPGPGADVLAPYVAQAMGYRNEAEGFAEDAETAAQNATVYYASRVSGPIPVTSSGAVASNSFTFFWGSSLKPYDQVATKLKIAVGTRAIGQIVVARLETDGSLTMVHHEPFEVDKLSDTGNTVAELPINVLVPGNCVIGVWLDVGNFYYTRGPFTGDYRWFVAPQPSFPWTNVPKSIDQIDGIQFSFELYGYMAGTAASTVPELASTIGVSQIIGRPIPVTTTGGAVPGGYTVMRYDPVAQDGLLSRVLISCSAGSVATLQIVTRDPSTGAVTIVSEHPINVLSGRVNDIPLNIPVLKGQYLAISSGYNFLSGGGEADGGIAVYYLQHKFETGDVPAISNLHSYQFQFFVETGMQRDIAEINTRLDNIDEEIGTSYDRGWPTISTTGEGVPNPYGMLLADVAQKDGYITQVRLDAPLAGTVKLLVVDFNLNGDASGGTVSAIVSTTVLDVSAGLNAISTHIAIQKGQYIGFQDNFLFQGNTNPLNIAVYYLAGQPVVNGSTMTRSIQHSYSVGVTIKTGLLAEIGDSNGGADTAGLNVLDPADPTGTYDSTAAFAQGRAQHPYPYVRPGTFKVTQVPISGDGLWGPGKILVNDKRFFIPRMPDMKNRLTLLRATLMQHAAAGNVLAFIGDSITHWAYASTGAKHYLNMLTSFVNLGIADDQPVMTAIRPLTVNNYFPTFYGVSEVNGGNITTGNKGPISESAILAAGSGYSFVGDLEQVDMFYERAAGAGSLVFSFNGTPYKTVNCSGSTASDTFTNAGATPSPGTSGTFTVIASGGPVEVTGLVRLGTKTPLSPPRMRTGRFAHGGYSVPNFMEAQIASVAKQCQYAGGKMVPVIALGTNDSPGSTYDQIYTSFNGLIDRLMVYNPPEIFGLMPVRPTAANWAEVYTTHYDPTVGALRKVYRERGVKIIPTDCVDYTNEGFYQDGLHPNDAGFDIFAQACVDAFIAATAGQ